MKIIRYDTTMNKATALHLYPREQSDRDDGAALSRCHDLVIELMLILLLLLL